MKLPIITSSSLPAPPTVDEHLSIAPSPSHRPEGTWPKRVKVAAGDSGLKLPVPAQLMHEKTITAIARQPYSHGGFMILARSFWQDMSWRQRLMRLMPEVFEQVTGLIGERTLLQALPQTMALLENNPVLAAYGTSRAGRNPPAIEWDVWLSPNDASDLDGARIIHGNAVAESLAAKEPQLARHILEVGVSGSDVHTGPSVLRWKALFEQALRESGTTRRPAVLQPLFLDVKSTYSTAKEIDEFVTALKFAGFCVRGVGTFEHAQLEGMHAALPVRLFDTADDLVEAQRTGTLPEAASAMFNGGFLLQPKAHKPNEWQIDSKALSNIAAAQQSLRLNLAIYTQETQASWQALDCLTQMVNANAHIFAMGFAYSGIQGIADSTLAVGRGVMMLYAQTL